MHKRAGLTTSGAGNHTRVLFQQPAYAHYRKELFTQLCSFYEMHFVFNRNWSHYPSQSGEPVNCWSSSVLHTERRGGLYRLLKVHLANRYDCLVAALPTSLSAIVGTVFAKLARRKVVYWSLAWHAPGWPNGQHRLHNRVKSILFRILMWQADAVVVPGSKARKYHLGLGVAPEKVFTANHSSDDMTLRPPTVDRVPEILCRGKSTVLYLGRILALKGVDILIRAFAQVENAICNVQLVIVGEGDYKVHCEELARRLSAASVYFLSGVPNEDVHMYYEYADVFVLPDSGRGQTEAFGLAVNEAMSMSLPIVITEMTGGSDDQVKHAHNGYLVKANDVGSLTEALYRLLTDKPLRLRMGQMSRSMYEEFNSYDKMTKGFVDAITFAMQG